MMKRNLLHRYFSARVLPIRIVLLVGVPIIAVSSLLAYALRYDLRNLFSESSSIDVTIVCTVAVNLIFFRAFRTYSNVLHFSPFVDIMRIFATLIVLYVLLLIASIVVKSFTNIDVAPITALFISYIINFAMMACSRTVVKIFLEALNFDGSRSANVFIYGVKEAGVNIAKVLRASLRDHYRLRGFIADEPELINKAMMGVKVFPNNDTLIENLDDWDVYTIIISPAKTEALKHSDMADRLLAHNIKLTAAPPLSEWNNQFLNRTRLEEIQTKDLLQRNPIEIDTHKVASHLEGKRVMITGAAGFIGSEIMCQVASFNPYKLILVGRTETPLHDIRLELQDRWRDTDAETIIADISNMTRMEEIFRRYKPQYIFHATAYKHVPMMEDNVSESIQVNVYGTRTVADLAMKYGAEKFVMISTDKVANLTNVMGRSKRTCEIYMQPLVEKSLVEGGRVTQFITTRFGNVLGSNGSVIPRFRDQIQRGGSVTATHPETICYFMTIPEARRLVLETGSMGNGGEIYILDIGKPVRAMDLVKRMVSLSGRMGVKIELTGLCHGEKLYEGLLNVKELTKPTHHEEIMIATVREYDYDEANECIQKLIDVSYIYDQMKIVAAMKDIVPESVSKNSCSEVLDKEK